MRVQRVCRFLILTLISSSLLIGCASTAPNEMLAQEGLSMVDIYHQVNNGVLYNDEAQLPSRRPSKTTRGRANKPFSQTHYLLTGNTNNNPTRFKPLPNPVVPLYVYPHLVGMDDEQHPVPGYTTAFFLYRTNHFALTDERWGL